MDISTFSDLLTPTGQEAIQTALTLQPREVDFLSHYQVLTQKFRRELARAALETAILRGEAHNKFPQADKMYFTRQALQQATGYEVSSYRAGRFKDFGKVIDLGCSIGGDTLAFAEVAHTLGIDLDPLRLLMAQANLQALHLKADILQADVSFAFPFTLHPSALFFDPARRTEYRRIFSVHEYLPPLSIIREWLLHFPALGVKISPGVNLDELMEYDCEIEFISLNGELKEAVLWFGPLKTVESRATILPGPHTMVGSRLAAGSCPLSEPKFYLYEPDPAVLRAGLVRDLADNLNAAQLDPDIAYLTADKKILTPFARVWEIEDWFPFQLKRLRATLRERDIGRVVVKKRGSPIQPEDLIRDLKLKGESERVVFLTHLNGRPIVIICKPND
jgi:SAM-dependent methyltransferase